MTHSIRIATPKDGPACADIYKFYVETTAITFETVSPSGEEMGRRIANVLDGMYLWLVYQIDMQIVGYAYASRFHERQAYQFTALPSVYVSKDHHRRGIATCLYRALINGLQTLGFCQMVVHISMISEAPASVELHKKMGFEPAGLVKDVGRKFGKWWSVLTMQAPLSKEINQEEIAINPEPQRHDLAVLRESPQWGLMLDQLVLPANNN